MRILLLIDSLGPGGAQRQMVGLAKLLQGRGNQIKVVYYHPIYFYRAYLDKYHIQNEYVEGAQNIAKRIFQIARVIGQFHPEVVISYLDTPNMIACLIKVLGMKYRLIASERNTSQLLNRKEKAKFFLLRWANVIVSNSFSQKQFIEKYYPQYREKTIVIINFVDLETYCPLPNKGRSHVIIVVASVWNPKNTMGLIEAAKIIKKHGHLFTIKWYGVDLVSPYVNDCITRIKDYGLEDVFQLLPKTSLICQEYRKADFFCLPSFYEGTSNSLCEALACGLPIICSNVCDNGIYVEEDVNGYLFNPHQVIDIANKIEKSLSLPDEKYQSYCNASRKIAEAHFSQERFIEEYIALLKNGKKIN